jgi:hypothetical protein
MQKYKASLKSMETEYVETKMLYLQVQYVNPLQSRFLKHACTHAHAHTCCTIPANAGTTSKIQMEWPTAAPLNCISSFHMIKYVTFQGFLSLRNRVKSNKPYLVGKEAVSLMEKWC